MNQILHILKKDLHRYAWAWITLSILAGIEIYLHGTTTGLLDNKLNGMLTYSTSMVGAILFFVVVVMMVQEESLADPDAYWLGRPIARGKLLIEKLLFVLILIGIYTLSDIISLTLNGGALRIPYALLGILSSLAIWQIQVFLAAQTRSLPRYLLLTVCLIIIFYALSFTLMIAAFSGSAFDLDLNPALLPAEIPGHTVALIQTLYWLLVGLGILSFLYLRRKVLISWLLLIPAVLIALCLTPKDSYYGIDTTLTYFSGETEIEITHLRQRGTMQTNGNEYIGYEAILNIEHIDDDIWASVSEVTIENDGQEFEFESSGMVQKLKIEPDGSRSLRLGHLKISETLDTNASFNVRCSLQLSYSKQVEIERLDLVEGAAHVKDGNRLIVRSLYRSDNQLNIDLAGTVPEYSLEPSPLKGDYEALGGQFSFALADRQTKTIHDFNLSQSWGDFGAIKTATIKIPLSDDAELNDYEIIVYSRTINGQEWEYIHANDISVR